MTRLVIVTGAASGNGKAIATRFLREGETVIAQDLDDDALQTARQQEWRLYAERVRCCAGDISREESIQICLDAAEQTGLGIEVLVNNAGITGGEQAARLHETPPEIFDRVMSVNVRAIFLFCRQVLPLMLARGGGTIVNVASVAASIAFPGRAAYTISKGAVLQLTRSIAADYASLGIRCNAVCPGMIYTAMTSWRLDQPELREATLRNIPQGEIGKPEDVAAAVAFLASDESRYCNGSALVADGGWSVI